MAAIHAAGNREQWKKTGISALGYHASASPCLGSLGVAGVGIPDLGLLLRMAATPEARDQGPSKRIETSSLVACTPATPVARSPGPLRMAVGHSRGFPYMDVTPEAANLGPPLHRPAVENHVGPMRASVTPESAGPGAWMSTAGAGGTQLLEYAWWRKAVASGTQPLAYAWWRRKAVVGGILLRALWGTQVLLAPWNTAGVF